MNKDICIGTGLVALDVILNGKPETPPKFHAGGSCGNVLSILSYLGWSSYPVARLAKNAATKEIEKDFKKWEVQTSLISKTEEGSTPIIIHRILRDKNGNPKHRFEFKDPDTAAWLPQYKPVLSKEVDSIVDKQPNAKVFYFDRINRSSIDLAKANKANGAVIFFEPSSIGTNEKAFNECLQVADIIKFSIDRISNYAKLFPKQQVCLEIETVGKEGIRYRYSKEKKASNWSNVKPYIIKDAIDSAGAGDWCSAGIIDKLCKQGQKSFDSSSAESVKSALQYGQLLGALNCCFDGARGIMYNIAKNDFSKLVKKIQTTNSLDLTKVEFPKAISIVKRKPIQISSLYTS
ncbi:MAG TPA: PfkB family carbohydrate kinase [Flavobacteriales bacterium]|nr:PfkB family carbohydrate kinase [Flavobacteriales bacterium]HRE95521.1 PfkB family carbohydrate kinase [Flavobacteriales bacterium]HRJ38953.1 PfkB family carbohydrate kinase [Flavobacteriales bacterium]